MWDKFIQLIKLPLKYLFGICVVSGLLLFTGDNFLIKIGIKNFVNENRSYIGIIFLISLIFVINDIISAFFHKLKRKFAFKRNLKIAKERLNNLTEEEKSLLSEYIINQTRTINLPYNNGTVRELEQYKIIYISSNVSREYLNFDYNIQPWAWKYLNKHKELLA